MILNLHVENLALVKETDIDFTRGLNILTGETGAGKSIILGSINLCLGAKAGAEVIGRYSDSALVELTFQVSDEKKLAILNEMDIYPEDGILTITRRINDKRSIIKINGETSSANVVKSITELLLDIHGQHDHESLLKRSKHLEILDKYAKDELKDILPAVAETYSEYKDLCLKLTEFNIDEEERIRNTAFIKYEIDEIDNANLLDGEDEELEALYRRMNNSQRIVSDVSEAQRLLSEGSGENASDFISRAYASLNNASRYDDGIGSILSQLGDVDNLLNDLNRELSEYASSLEFDEQAYNETEKRLDLINGLKAKYGNSILAIKEYRDKAAERLAFYEDYENRMQQTQKAIDKKYAELLSQCEKVSSIRAKAAQALAKKIAESLIDLNFLQAKFEISMSKLLEPTANGIDAAEFMISTNPGEDLKPLSKIASGGEMSRIMLGIKAVLANRDDIDTLVFDEIDTGISGRTAQKVSEKMAEIATGHQILCITHLPQIAAMADTHFLIEKAMDKEHTITSIKRLSEDEITIELARMLSGYETTDLVLENARQMKSLANSIKRQ